MSMNKIMVAILAVAISSTAAAQSAEKKKKFDIPGTFLLEVGFTIPVNSPEYFGTHFFGSRTCNVYYQFEWTPFKKLLPQWSLVPGLGMSFEHYSFNSGRTLSYGSSGDNTDGTSSSGLSMSQRRLDISKSKLMTHYFDLPLEIRYTFNPTDPNRSFKVGAGFRIGYLFNAHTKIIYDDKQTGASVKEKLERDWNLNTFRYGAFLKLGVGNVSLFGYYNLNPLFRTNLGPDKTKMNNMVIGLSINGF